MYRTAAAGGVFVIVVFFLLSGGLFVTLGSLLPEGIARHVVVVVFGVVFAGTFLALLVSRVRHLYAGKGHFWLEVVLAALNVGLLLCAFAAVYATVGIADTTGDGPESITYGFADCLYYSFVTFTTLGYGDLQPRGVARIIAALQAFVGYLVLGILASTSATLIQNSVKDSQDA